MNFTEYQREAKSTAVYDQPIIYPTLGLAGESGEVAEKVKKMIRDDGGELTQERKTLLIKELGDVLWYLAMIAHDIGVSLDDVATTNISKLKMRMEKGLLKGDGDTREVSIESKS